MFYNSNCCTIGSLMNNITKVNIVHKLEQNVCINNYKILPQICSVNYYCKMLFCALIIIKIYLTLSEFQKIIWKKYFMLSKFFRCLVNNIVNTLNVFSLLDTYKICRCLIKFFECLPQLR